MTTLTRIDPARNMQRFYAVTVQPNLFGEWTLVREWGRIGRRPQQLLHTFTTQADAEHARSQWMTVKQRRGYEHACH